MFKYLDNKEEEGAKEEWRNKRQTKDKKEYRAVQYSGNKSQVENFQKIFDYFNQQLNGNYNVGKDRVYQGSHDRKKLGKPTPQRKPKQQKSSLQDQNDDQEIERFKQKLKKKTKNEKEKKAKVNTETESKKEDQLEQERKEQGASKQFEDNMCSIQEFEERMKRFLNADSSLDNYQQGSFSIFQLNPVTKKPDPKLAIKRFKRPSPGEEQEQKSKYVRSPKCLFRTISHILSKVVDADKSNNYVQFCGEINFQKIHGFMWNRLRAINKDISMMGQQHYTKRQIVLCVQYIARFFILSINEGRQFDSFNEKYNKETVINAIKLLEKSYRYAQNELFQFMGRATLQSMTVTEILERMEMEGVYLSPNVPEFASYALILDLESINFHKLLYNLSTIEYKELGDYKAPLLNSRQIRMALELAKAIKAKNYYRYFEIVEDSRTSYLMSCCALIHLKELRINAMNVLLKGIQLSFDWVVEVLGFDKNSNNLLNFLQKCGFKKTGFYRSKLQHNDSNFQIERELKEIKEKPEDYRVEKMSLKHKQEIKGQFRREKIIKQTSLCNYQELLIRTILLNINKSTTPIQQHFNKEYNSQIEKAQPVPQIQPKQKNRTQLLKVMYRVFTNCYQRKIKKIKNISNALALVCHFKKRLLKQAIKKIDQYYLMKKVIKWRFGKWLKIYLSIKNRREKNRHRMQKFLKDLNCQPIDYSYYNFGKFIERENILNSDKNNRSNNSLEFSFSNPTIILKAIQKKQQQKKLANFWGLVITSILNYGSKLALKSISNFFYKVNIFLRPQVTGQKELIVNFINYFYKEGLTIEEFEEMFDQGVAVKRLEYKIYFKEEEYSGEKVLYIMINLFNKEYRNSLKQFVKEQDIFGSDLNILLLINQENQKFKQFISDFQELHIISSFQLLVIKIADQYNKHDDIQYYIRYNLQPPYPFKDIHVVPVITESTYIRNKHTNLMEISDTKRSLLSIVVNTIKDKIHFPEISKYSFGYLIREIRYLLKQVEQLVCQLDRNQQLAYLCVQFINKCWYQLSQVHKQILENRHLLPFPLQKNPFCQLGCFKILHLQEPPKSYKIIINYVSRMVEKAIPRELVCQEGVYLQLQEVIPMCVLANGTWEGNWVGFYSFVLSIFQCYMQGFVYLPVGWRFELSRDLLVQHEPRPKPSFLAANRVALSSREQEVSISEQLQSRIRKRFHGEKQIN